MLHSLDIIVISVYFSILLLIGVIVSRKIKNVCDFLVSGRNLGKFLTTMLGLGGAISTDTAISVVAQSYRTGISGIWFQWVYLFGTATAWLLAPVCRRARVHTAAEFYRLRYSRAFSVFYAIVGIIVLTLIIAIVLFAMAETIDGVTLGGISRNVAIMITAAIILFYGLLGGLAAAAIVDAFQGLLILFMSFGLIPFLLYKIGGMDSLHRALDPSMFSLATPKEMTLYVVIMFSIQAVIGTPGGPNVIPGYQASKDEMAARIGNIVGSLIKRICTIGWVLIGLCAIVLFKNEVPPEQADKVFGVAVRNLLPHGLTGLMIAAMFAMAMSACAAMMVFASGLFLKDILPVLLPNKQFNNQRQLIITRCVGFLVVIGGILVAYLIPNIRVGYVYIWQFTLFACFPFWGGVIWRRGTTVGAWSSIIGSFIIWLIMELTCKKYFSSEYTLKATEFLVCLPTGFGLFILFSLLSKPENDQKLDHFYKRLRTPIGSDPEIDALDGVANESAETSSEKSIA